LILYIQLIFYLAVKKSGNNSWIKGLLKPDGQLLESHSKICAMVFLRKLIRFW